MEYKNILALDAASDVCSTALLYNGILQEITSQGKQFKSLNLLQMIDQLLAGIKVNDLAALAFSAGPGSLTGLKISSSVIQALNLVFNKPIIKVSTLQALALQAYEEYGAKYIMPCMDAKMGQIYYGLYRIKDHGSMSIPMPIQEDTVSYIEDVKMPDPSILFGDGSKLLSRSNYSLVDAKVINSSAKYIVKIANYIYINYDCKVNDAIPLYLRLYK